MRANKYNLQKMKTILLSIKSDLVPNGEITRLF